MVREVGNFKQSCFSMFRSLPFRIFFGRKMLAGTFFRVDKKLTLAFSIFRWMHEQSRTVLMFLTLFFYAEKKGLLGPVTFRLGHWTIFGSSFSLMGLLEGALNFDLIHPSPLPIYT